MPELAEVEIVRRNLAQWWLGRAAEEVVLLDEKLPTNGSAEQLERLLRSPLRTLMRRGKYLVAGFDQSDVVLHFRMSGKIVLEPSSDGRFARLAWRVADGWLVFKDQRRLGTIDVVDAPALTTVDALVRMGPEPTDLDVSWGRALRARRRLLKAALLDQSVVAGVGNIAISEVFHRVRLRPDVRANELSAEQLQSLIDTLPPYFEWLIAQQAAGEVVYLGETGAVNEFDVYGRQGEPCPRCGAPIERGVVAGRSSFWCPTCVD